MAVVMMLAACSTTPEIQYRDVIKEVKVPVSVPCIKKKPVRPDYQFGVGEMPSDTDMAAILAEDFEKAEQYGLAWEAAAAGCSVTPSP